MILSIIDIGTSSIKHSIFDVDLSTKKTLHYKRYSEANLGGADVIPEVAIQRSLGILRECKALNDERGVVKVRLLGTDIFRKALNAAIFCDQIKILFGVEIEVITQDKEALLLYEGFLETIPVDFSFAAVNIGGGSTELVVGGKGLIGAVKIPFGVKHIMKTFGSHDDIDWVGLDSYLETEIQFDYTVPALFTTGVLPFMREIRPFVRFDAVDSGFNEHPFCLSVDEFRQWIERLRTTPIMELKAAYAKDPSYCDGITIGQSIYYACAKKLGVEIIIPSAHDLTDGVVYEMTH